MKIVPKYQTPWGVLHKQFDLHDFVDYWRDNDVETDEAVVERMQSRGINPDEWIAQRLYNYDHPSPNTDGTITPLKEEKSLSTKLKELGTSARTSLNEMGNSWVNFWDTPTTIKYSYGPFDRNVDGSPHEITLRRGDVATLTVGALSLPLLGMGLAAETLPTVTGLVYGTGLGYAGNVGGHKLAQTAGLNENALEMFGDVIGFGGATLGGMYGTKVGKDVSEGLDYLGVTLPEYLRGYKYGIDVYHGTPTNTFSPKDLKTNDILGLHFGDSETPALYFANVDRGGRIIKGRYLAKESPIFMDADLDSYYTLDWFYDNDPNFVKFLKSKGMAQEELDHLGWAPKIKMGTPEERLHYLADLYKKYGLDFFYRNSAESGGINAGIERSLITMRPERFKPTHLLLFDDPKGMDWSKQKLLSFSEKTPEEQTAILKLLRGDKKYKRIGYSWF